MIKIGLFGFGVVGQGFYDIVQQKQATSGVEVSKICVRTPNKSRSLPAHFFTYDADDLLTDPDITHIIEVTDGTEDAFDIVKKGLENGKTVISANKKMLAEHQVALQDIQQKTGNILLNEAAACGSIPVFGNLYHYYQHDQVTHISGIFNGSTNYILSRMAQEGLSFEAVLTAAQALGFAESDPTLDIEAFDPAYKLTLLVAAAFGQIIQPENVLRLGISTVTSADIKVASQHQCAIKLINCAELSSDGQLHVYVLPAFIPVSSPFYHVQNEYNGILIRSALLGDQLLTGKGAGSHPTGFAVWSDLESSIKESRRPIAPKKTGVVSDEKTIAVYYRGLPKHPFTFATITELERSESELRLTGTIQLTDLRSHLDWLHATKGLIAVVSRLAGQVEF